MVRTSSEDDVLTITIEGPETRNAQDPRVWAELAHIGRELPDHVQVVLLRSTGPVFSSGLDLGFLDPANPEGAGELLRLDDTQLDERIAAYQEAFTWWREASAVTIAVVQGAAVGAGFQLALATDLVVATPAARFAIREPDHGLIPDLGGTVRLLEQVGYSRALDICSTGRWVQAEEALALGIVNRLVDSDSLEAELAALVERLRGPRSGPVRALKGLLRTGVGRSAPDQLAAERAAQVQRLRVLGKP